jgi:hypothetical protein
MCLSLSIQSSVSWMESLLLEITTDTKGLWCNNALPFIAGATAGPEWLDGSYEVSINGVRTDWYHQGTTHDLHWLRATSKSIESVDKQTLSGTKPTNEFHCHRKAIFSARMYRKCVVHRNFRSDHGMHARIQEPAVPEVSLSISIVRVI